MVADSAISAATPDTLWRDQWSKEQRNLARRLVLNALKSGELVHQPCRLCGAAYAVAHHNNYDEPLAVDWLCRSHHGKRHIELDRPHPSYRRLTDALITYQGETLSVSDWAAKVRLHPSTLYYRVFRLNWPVAFALWCRPCSRHYQISRIAHTASACLRELQGNLASQEASGANALKSTSGQLMAEARQARSKASHEV